MLFGTIKAPGWGDEELGLCDCKKRKALPGDKPSDAIGVTPKKESPMRKGPCLSCSLPEYISVTSFLKHRFQNIKLLFLTSPYTATVVHAPKWSPTTPAPFWSWMLQRGIAWQRRAPQDADLSPSVSIPLAACSRPPRTHCSEGLQCTDSVCHT